MGEVDARVRRIVRETKIEKCIVKLLGGRWLVGCLVV